MRKHIEIRFIALAAVCAALILSQQIAEACTGIQVETKDGVFVSGRTLEFGIFFETSVIVVPRGYEFTGQTTLGDGKQWKAKYASVGVIIADNEIILDGINEMGLSVGNFYF
ncbi:MAG: linear amide C-N hydrolase, partial [Spirochaetaceae bacterium]|nr:linear amide C-N hydrolase [Spirochaetaceae bacterium]